MSKRKMLKKQNKTKQKTVNQRSPEEDGRSGWPPEGKGRGHVHLGALNY